ncbi:dodecenoyl-CoA isomerase [Terramyces sp. JEL0728]|nr:dodecenoyl-CoA isomerase [Terramyces sp. JEL0728]
MQSMKKRLLSTLSTEFNNGIYKLTLNYKPVNALEPKLLNELHQELVNIHKNKEIKGLILKSAFPKVLSAGLDLKTLVDHPEYFLPDDERKATRDDYLQKYKEHISSYMGLFQDVVRLLITVPMPSVAIVRGAAPAGGTVLSLACDERVGSANGFSMGLTEVMVGMAPPKWVHQLARNALGNRKAAIAVQQGKMYPNNEALEIGYVDHIVPEEQLISKAEEIIKVYTKLPWNARLDAKLKSVETVTNEINPEGLEAVVESISGDEFQAVVKGLLKSLKNKNK